MLPENKHSQVDVLNGWKEISGYLRKGVRSAQRYELELGLPVHRPGGKLRGSVMATERELDAWVAASPIREAFHLQQSRDDKTAFMFEFKQNLQSMAELRKQSADLRQDLRESWTRFRGTLNGITSEFQVVGQGQSALLTGSERALLLEEIPLAQMQRRFTE